MVDWDDRYYILILFKGGQPSRALYFIGRINNSYIYLDPHKE